jgi:hypothetical protein
MPRRLLAPLGLIGGGGGGGSGFQLRALFIGSLAFGGGGSISGGGGSGCGSLLALPFSLQSCALVVCSLAVGGGGCGCGSGGLLQSRAVQLLLRRCRCLRSFQSFPCVKGQAYIARHVIQRIWKPRFWSKMTSYDAASNVCHIWSSTAIRGLESFELDGIL